MNRDPSPRAKAKRKTPTQLQFEQIRKELAELRGILDRMDRRLSEAARPKDPEFYRPEEVAKPRAVVHVDSGLIEPERTARKWKAIADGPPRRSWWRRLADL